MAEFVPVLEQVRVTAQRERGLEFVGFNRRKRSANGTFFEEKDLNKNAVNFSDVMRIAPGIRVAPAGNGKSMLVSSRSTNGCVNVWIDGTLWQQMEPGDVDDFVKPHELAAMEVYSPVNTPAEFQQKGGSCQTVIVWTIRRLERRTR